MTFIRAEGKFNHNTYLLDALMFGMKGNANIYIIENKGQRLMIDTTTPASMMRKIITKIKNLGLYPIHKLVLTHTHWDHIDGVNKLLALMNDMDIQILASANAIDTLRYPNKMNQKYEVNIDPIEKIHPLYEGDIINLNGLELEVINLFGHTQDLIGLLDFANKNIFAGDSVINKYDPDTFLPVFLSQEYNESELIKTFKKLKNLGRNFTSITLSHFGVWTDNDCDQILKDMEDLHQKTKNSLIEWYLKNPCLEDITYKYHETYIPNSLLFTKDNLTGLSLAIKWLIEGLIANGDL